MRAVVVAVGVNNNNEEVSKRARADEGVNGLSSSSSMTQRERWSLGFGEMKMGHPKNQKIGSDTLIPETPTVASTESFFFSFSSTSAMSISFWFVSFYQFSFSFSFSQ